MAYDTGTAATPAALLSTIQTFAQANGWTLTGTVLSKSISYIRLTAVGDNTLKIEGSNEDLFTTGAAPDFARLRHDTWPCTYYLFAHGNDIYCVASPDNSTFAFLAFGEVAKYGTWTGGNWFGASLPNTAYTAYPTVWSQSGATPQGGQRATEPGGFVYDSGGALFLTNSYAENNSGRGTSYIHAEIDGYTWRGAGYPVALAGFVRHMTAIDKLLLAQPNAWNGQAVLIPYYLVAPRPASKASLIGEIPYIRSLRIDNLAPGDVITLGADKWKVFPWVGKDSANRDGYNTAYGNGYSGLSGTFGWAIKYDGP